MWLHTSVSSDVAVKSMILSKAAPLYRSVANASAHSPVQGVKAPIPVSAMD